MQNPFVLPFVPVKSVPVAENEPPIIEEVEQIIASAEPPYLHLFQFLRATGVRVGEALALQPQAINRKLRRISVTGKSKRYRTVPFSPNAEEAWDAVGGAGFSSMKYDDVRKY